MNSNTPNLALGFEQSAPIDRPDVLALQSLVMGPVRRQVIQSGRPINFGDDPRSHSFCVFQDSGPDLESGETDVYLGVRVRKIGHREWGMGISFLENELTPETRCDNKRTLYQLRWDDESAAGRIIERTVIGKQVFYDEQIRDMPVLPGVETVGKTVITPMPTDVLDQIANRALDIVYTAPPRKHPNIDFLLRLADQP